ncbi:hypothetical protein FSC37_22440 [Piscinibacter aquaticus]|uniref:Uncharacterized protein n=1 Tax=Piscinibacter aquaticus TaxID=392597 RepID=A0A5C6TN18_9BURK|nr:hypothetical protein FSC37_22440 [Piscinibacter aquaticus]
MVCYKHGRLGNLLHFDAQKLGRIEYPSNRVTGNRRDSLGGASWEALFVVVDDRARIASAAEQVDEKTPQAVSFLRYDLTHCAGLGATVRRVLIESGATFRFK